MPVFVPTHRVPFFPTSPPASLASSPCFCHLRITLLQHELAQVDVCHPSLKLNPRKKFQCWSHHAVHSLASVAGTQEPIYGPEAIQSVAKQTEAARYTELTKEDLRWRAYQYTNVETQTFYVMADNGTLVMVQVIYSNIV